LYGQNSPVYIANFWKAVLRIELLSVATFKRNAVCEAKQQYKQNFRFQVILIILAS